MINDLFFVYGSLLNADNEFGSYLNNHSTLIGAGKFKGRLYDINEYPGALTDNENGYPITGSIYKLNSFKALTILDDYEGFGPDQEQPNLFIRELLPIETSEGIINCWVYVYNLEIDGLTEIKSGDYVRYLHGM
jgi:gamma-glutamylcyclotransferase (GGCT)/AIG2-like uncharacterized protein YtfP